MENRWILPRIRSDILGWLMPNAFAARACVSSFFLMAATFHSLHHIRGLYSMRAKESELARNSAVMDSEMESILREMLDSDQDITARAVAKKHPRLSAASSITAMKAW